MLPAFEDWRSAARFSALLLVLLLLPAILARVGLPPRSEVYNGLRVGGGPYVKTRQQLFATEGEIDVAFVGSSAFSMAIDVDEMQSRFEERFGPGVNLRMFGYAFQGYDMQYVMMRDLLEHRRVKMLVMTFTGPRQATDRPHVQLHNMLRWGEFPEMVEGLPLSSRAAIYASCVLDGPRQFVKYLRPEQPIDADDDHRSIMKHEAVPAIVAEPAPAVRLSEETRHHFTFGDPELSDRQRHFATRIAELAAKHRVELVIVNLPLPEEFHHDQAWERADWTALPGKPTVIMFRRSDLFGDAPASQLFADSVHMTAEAQKRFTLSITAFLENHYAEISAR